MRNTAIGVLACVGALAAPLGAQTQYNVRVAVALAPRGKYEVPLCPLKGGDYRTASAGLYLKTAAEGMTDDLTNRRSQVDSKKYTDIVNKAIKAATDAIAANPQSAAGWYYLGRGDLQLGDLRGADSAFTRVETLSPDCAIEIKGLRQKAWLVLVQPSTEFMRAGQLDSSLAVLRDAMIIARYYPQGFYNLAGTFANMKPQPMIDSAIFYFKIAQEKSATDTQFASTLKNATYNMAYLYQSAGDNQNAIVQYRKYLAIDPNDVDVKRALASTLRLTGSPAEAAQLEQQLMSSGSMTTGELATMGVQLLHRQELCCRRRRVPEDPRDRSREPRRTVQPGQQLLRDGRREEADRDLTEAARHRSSRELQSEAPRQWVPARRRYQQADRSRDAPAGDPRGSQHRYLPDEEGRRKDRRHGDGQRG